jgi:hypothetical protein
VNEHHVKVYQIELAKKDQVITEKEDAITVL